MEKLLLAGRGRFGFTEDGQERSLRGDIWLSSEEKKMSVVLRTERGISEKHLLGAMVLGLWTFHRLSPLPSSRQKHAT